MKHRLKQFFKENRKFCEDEVVLPAIWVHIDTELSLN